MCVCACVCMCGGDSPCVCVWRRCWPSSSRQRAASTQLGPLRGQLLLRTLRCRHALRPRRAAPAAAGAPMAAPPLACGSGRCRRSRSSRAAEPASPPPPRPWAFGLGLARSTATTAAWARSESKRPGSFCAAAALPAGLRGRTDTAGLAGRTENWGKGDSQEGRLLRAQGNPGSAAL